MNGFHVSLQLILRRGDVVAAFIFTCDIINNFMHLFHMVVEKLLGKCSVFTASTSDFLRSIVDHLNMLGQSLFLKEKKK